MTDFSDGFERFQRGMEENLSDFARMQELIEAAVGRGEAADGRIYAEYRAQGGLTALDLDPRALRLPSEELSEQIRAAVNAASADFQTQVKEAAGALYPAPDGSAGEMDRAAALRKLDQISDGFAGQMKDLARELGVQQQRAKDAMANLRDVRAPGTSPQQAPWDSRGPGNRRAPGDPFGG